MNDSTMVGLGDWLKRAMGELEAAGVESPGLSGRLILSEVTGFSSAKILGFPEIFIPPDALFEADVLLERRLRHEPMAYILGRKEFRNITLKVTPAVLIPRPETEELIDLTQSICPDASTMVDVGSGSGCIPLSLSEVFPESRVVGTDFSQKALKVAQSNDPDRRISWVQSDWLAGFDRDRFDLIVSNPPYLTHDEMESLDPQVGEYEPISALTGGEDGCDAYRVLVPQIARCLKHRGKTVLEISPSVENQVIQILGESGFVHIRTHPDWAGRARFATGERPNG